MLIFWSRNLLCANFASGTYCMLIFLFLKTLGHSFFSSWNLYVDFSPPETDFAYRTCCMLIFVHWISCLLFFSWNMLYLNLSLREAFQLFFLVVKLILFWLVVKLIGVLIYVIRTCWLLSFICEMCCMNIFPFVKLLHWFFTSRNWFCSWKLTGTYFSSWICCELIFIRETCRMLIFICDELVH